VQPSVTVREQGGYSPAAGRDAKAPCWFVIDWDMPVPIGAWFVLIGAWLVPIGAWFVLIGAWLVPIGIWFVPIGI
jgi:hypothetical protein